MAGTIFWLLVVVSGILFTYGLFSKSWKHLLISGLAVALPALYFLGAENGFRLLALVPLLPFGLGYFFAKHKKESR